MTQWLETATDYKVGIRDGKVIAQNKAGKVLSSVPSKLKDDDVTANLRAFMDWLSTHERQVAQQVNDWMVLALPVTAVVLVQVWQDESWRQNLTDLVIFPCTSTGTPTNGSPGFLRNADSRESISVVTLDGETEHLLSAHFLIAHPIHLGDELDDFREFASDLGIAQETSQLMRETFTIGQRDLGTTSIEDYSGGDFEALQHLTSRAHTLGYAVKGGFAVCQLNSNGLPLQAMTWLGAEDPTQQASTGPLSWVREGKTLSLADVGPVAFSEGMRMAARLYAGRKVESGDQES